MTAWLKMLAIALPIMLVMRFAGGCVADYQHEQNFNEAMQRRESVIVQVIPDCGKRSTMFTIDNDGIVHYFCGN